MDRPGPDYPERRVHHFAERDPGDRLHDQQRTNTAVLRSPIGHISFPSSGNGKSGTGTKTQQIAEHIAARLRGSGLSCDAINVKYLPASFSLNDYNSAILAASAHIGKHEPEMVRFVGKNSDRLEQMRTAFLSVSLAQAGVQDRNITPERREAAAADVKKMIGAFLAKTKWRPTRAEPVAGGLMYSKYNWFIRFVMKRIARRAGASTDTSRDHEFTDWVALDRFVNEFAALVKSG
ncbi:MAG TPA: flavodoxin domain-containing protein [Candidatus Angelobacter sp.]|nr:flavodoxin domain-containing protein [Candidatus Angelobacter sp.]